MAARRLWHRRTSASASVAALATLVVFTSGSALAEPFPPEPGALARAEKVAASYWHGTPPCGTPKIVFRTLNGEAGGQADVSTCTIYLAAEGDWAPYNVLCIAVAHEWGHLKLGTNYFAAVNPSDPAHNPVPGTLMNAQGPGYFAPCEPRYRRPSRSARHHAVARR
jgi:hypothetical protein